MLVGGRVRHLFILNAHLYVQELPTKKNPRGKNLNQRNSHEKIFWTHKISTGKKMSDPRNTREKKFRAHQIPTMKNFGPKKYSRKKISDPQNTHEKKFQAYEGTMTRWHKTRGS